jgi:hypothetical protein
MRPLQVRSAVETDDLLCLDLLQTSVWSSLSASSIVLGALKIRDPSCWEVCRNSKKFRASQPEAAIGMHRLVQRQGPDSGSLVEASKHYLDATSINQTLPHAAEAF